MGRELDNIDLTSAQRKEVTTLLSRYIPDAEVWAYGSRVKFSAKPNSDLDLVVFVSPKQKRAVYQLKEGFEESSLPFRVDLFVWDDVPAQFHKNIEKERVVLQRKKELENVPNKWQNVRLGDIAKITSGKRNVQDAIGDGEYPFFDRSKEIKRSNQFYIDDNAIIIADEGKTFQPRFYNGKFDLHQRAYAIYSFLPNANAKFLYYNIMLNSSYFERVAVGTTVKSLRQNHFLDFSVNIPPLAEQKAIASVLGALDDKIENNRRMNETLEEMARAVFKSWFVDFDPVHAKATLQNHSPLEGESANQRQSPQMSRWGGIKRQYTSKAQQRAQTLRKNPTDAEGLLWHYLRKKQLAGRKFRRQQPIGNYIVDFVCMSEQLVIELDGSQHAKQKSYDANRDQFIQDSGYRVLRYWNNQVLSDCYAVLEDIYNHLCPPPHQSSPNGSTSATPPPGGSDNHLPLNIEPMAHPLDAPPGGSDNHPPLDIEPMAHPLDAPPGGSDYHPPLDIEPMAHPLDAPPGGSDYHPPLDIEPMAHPLDAPPGGSDNHPPLDIEPMAHPLDASPGGSDNHPPLDIEPMAHPLDAPPGGSDYHPPLDIEPMAHPLDAPPGGSDYHPPLEGGSNSATPNLGRGNWTLERAKRYLAHINTATAALFPSSFGEDGLPVGWREAELKEICKFSSGSVFKKDKQGLSFGDHPFIKVSDMNLPNNEQFILSANNWVSEKTRAEIKAKLQPRGSIAIAKIGVALTYNRLRILDRNTILDNNMFAVIPNENVVRSTSLFLILTRYDFNFYAKGSALPYLNTSDLSAILFVLPSEKVFEAFEFYTRPLIEKVLLNSKENQTLAELRDTLLPKLMSGEIRIKDAEREVEAIA